MRFIYEALTARSIMRRAIEEEQRTGKRVTEIVLTRSEWMAFMHAECPNIYHEPRPELARYQLRRPPALSLPTDRYAHILDEGTITVRPEL